MRRAARTDENQQRIVDALRRAGIQVRVTSSIGEGFPDLLVKAKDGSLLLLEIKDGNKSPSRRRLTPAQGKMIEQWPVRVVINEIEALKVCGIEVCK